jgi:glycosyltransferase involved in cell wall biosynthesis
MPSIIEHHSASLREAMLVGAPCISALVGSVGNFVKNGESGLLYRDDDHFALANEIITLVRSPEYAKQLAYNGRNQLREVYDSGLSKSLFGIYGEVIEYNENNSNRIKRVLKHQSCTIPDK